jgi:ABC-type polysaccharide/polyol phosphate export permease
MAIKVDGLASVGKTGYLALVFRGFRYYRGFLSYQLDLLWHLVKRDFTLRYKGSVLGILWSLLLPLAQLLVLVFLFQRVIPLGIDSYPAFVFTALLPWTWFSSCLNSAGSLFLGNRDLIKKPGFSPCILVGVNTLSNLLLLLVVLPVLVIMIVAFYGKSLTLYFLLLPVLLGIHVMLIWGLCLFIATLNVFYRDIQYIMSVFVMLLFYLTPVFYNPSAITEDYRFLYNLNPLAVLIQAYRAIIFFGKAPEWGYLSIAFVISLLSCVVGYVFYRKKLHEIVDYI